MSVLFREIYLTGFEIAVKEGGAKAIMTSYKSGQWNICQRKHTSSQGHSEKRLGI